MNIFCHSFIAYKVSLVRYAVNPICLPVLVKDFFSPLSAFISLSLSLYFVNLTLICLGGGQLSLNFKGALCASCILMSVPFLRLGKFSDIICSHNLQPLFLTLSFGTPIVLFNKSLSSLSLVLWFFCLCFPPFFYFIILHNFVFYITDSLLWFIHPCRCGNHSRLNLCYTFVISSWLDFISFFLCIKGFYGFFNSS